MSSVRVKKFGLMNILREKYQLDTIPNHELSFMITVVLSLKPRINVEYE